MSMYNLLHGQNPLSDILLAAVDLTRQDVGRFRDAWVNEDGDIAVYTRNGGGNRECWHEESPEWGNKDCRNESHEVEDAVTGKRVLTTRYTCLAPCSAECGCLGCVAEYRLPAHPLYLRDEDDDFDRTYATFFFRPPEATREKLKSFGEKRDMDEVWLTSLRELQEGKRPEVVEALRPVLEAITQALGQKKGEPS